ncbi:MAG: potassium channel family protein [Methanocalculus sp.]|nr:potassium channel family protein [Methanocalculus sp.]MDG6251150.1 potassium channel family protein [Methanocalculus sp.]
MVSAPSRITISCTLLLLIVTAGVLGVMATEGLSLSDAVYFVVVTIATVGYGDIAPVTGAGRLIAVLIIIAGVGTFVSVFATAVEGLVSRSERRARQRKINMMMGLFFSEAGTELLGSFARLDPRAGELRDTLAPGSDPGAEDFRRMRRCLEGHGFAVDAAAADLPGLQRLLEGKKEFLLRLLENPALFEHDVFTDLLHAVFHLREELAVRDDLAVLSGADRTHLAGDISRAYRALALEWLGYLQHLHATYPYLYSLAARRNPFDESAGPVVR